MAQEMLDNLNFQLAPVPLADWQIKKEPLYIVFKTCKNCTQRVEIWSDKENDMDGFWCMQCSIVNKDAKMEPKWMVTADTTTTYMMAKLLSTA